MRPSLLIAAAVLTGCGALPPAADQGSLPHWKVLGLGNQTCLDFLRRPRPDSPGADPYVQWLLGYITYRNAGITPIDEVLGVADLNDPLTREPVAWLEDWCHDRLDNPFQQAADAVLAKAIREMRQRRIQENQKDRSDGVEIPAPGNGTP